MYNVKKSVYKYLLALTILFLEILNKCGAFFPNIAGSLMGNTAARNKSGRTA